MRHPLSATPAPAPPSARHAQSAAASAAGEPHAWRPARPKSSEPAAFATSPSAIVARQPSTRIISGGSGVDAAVASGYAANTAPTSSSPMKRAAAEVGKKGVSSVNAA